MAEELARMIERGLPVRRAAYGIINRILKDGKALGVEVRIRGKLMKKRSKKYRFQAGLLIHSGQPGEEFVRVGKAIAQTKKGTIGVQVKIIPPDVNLPDRLRVKKVSEVIGELEELKVLAEQYLDEVMGEYKIREIEEEIEEGEEGASETE